MHEIETDESSDATPAWRHLMSIEVDHEDACATTARETGVSAFLTLGASLGNTNGRVRSVGKSTLRRRCGQKLAFLTKTSVKGL